MDILYWRNNPDRGSQFSLARILIKENCGGCAAGGKICSFSPDAFCVISTGGGAVGYPAAEAEISPVPDTDSLRI